MDYYSAIKKDEIKPLAATWMELRIIILSEIVGKRQISYDITYMWNLKYDINKLIYTKQKQTHKCREQSCSCQGESGGGGGIVWEFGVSRWKLLSVEWTNSRVLLRSIGNYIQYPVINCNGREYEKECIYMYN